MRIFVLLALAILSCLLPVHELAKDGGSSNNHAAAGFPRAETILRDAKHKEAKSGAQLQDGHLTIRSGVGTPTAINSLSFSADGGILAAGKDFGRLVLWNVKERKFLRAIDTGQGQDKVVAVSPDGELVASGSNQDGHSVKLWNVSSGKMLWEFTGANSEITQLFFGAPGKWLVVGDNASNVYVLDETSGKAVATMANLHLVAQPADGGSMITVDGNEFAVWAIDTQTKSQSVTKPDKFSMLLTANLSSDRFAIYEKRVIKIGQFSTGKTTLELPGLVPMGFTWRPDFAAFSPDGATAYLSIDSHLTVLDAETGAACSGPTMYSGAAALSPNGRWLAGAKDDSILSHERTDGVWIWNTQRLLDGCGLTKSSQ